MKEKDKPKVTVEEKPDLSGEEVTRIGNGFAYIKRDKDGNEVERKFAVTEAKMAKLIGPQKAKVLMG